MNELSTGRKWLQRIGYAFSGFGGQVPKTLVDTFTSIFLLTAVGLKAADIAVMLLVAKIVDGITDYLVGIAIDATKCKFGKNRLWMLLSIPVTFVGVIMLFSSPGGFSYGMKLAWAYVSYILVTLGLTMAAVSANAIIPFLSFDPQERGALVSSKALLSMVGSLVVTGAVSALVNLTGGADAVSSYTKAAVAVGLVFAVMIAFGVFTLHETNFDTSLKDENGEKVKSNPIKDILILVKTKNYLILLVIGFLSTFTQVAIMNGAPYFAGYVLGNSGLTASILMPFMVGCMIPMALLSFLTKKFTKKTVVSIGAVLGAVLCVLLVIFGNTPIALALFSALTGVGFGMTYVTFFAMQPEVVDEVAYRHGRVMSGLQASIAGFACNLGSAFASSAVVALIGMSGFNADLATQTASTQMVIRLAAFIVPAISLLLILVFIRFYDLDEKYDEIRRALGRTDDGPDGAH